MTNEEYKKEVQKHFDPFEDIKVAVLTAQSFVNMGLLTEAQAIKEFKLTKALYDKYKALPES